MPIQGIGLIIPENTPEPEILVIQQSVGKESTEQPEGYSTTSKDTEEYSPDQD